ncbi:unnamed protein product [Symbiodinium natans]|uniref:Phospholipase B-like n=1 Tax=Symbiodinium natans TaxID=878477 RepID=A0A812J423_9DINO|nr:unnamed protein product [Symbiodinium natans]
MGAMGRLCARIFLVLLPPSAVSLCLEDGVPEQNRRYLSDTAASADESRTPIRMVMYDWGSAEMASTLTHILVTEHFGYHAVMNQQRTLGSFDGVLELAGCTTEDCSQRYAESHIAMECWMSEIPFQFARFAAEHPDKVPFDLGSIGYFGENSLSVRGAVRDDAYFTSGLSLEFYKSYNTTLHHPKLFFDSITDLDINDFAPCNTTGNNFANDVEMRAYGRWTGDWDGLEETESGYIAKCSDGSAGKSDVFGLEEIPILNKRL